MKGRRIPVELPPQDPCDVVTQAGDYYGPVMGWSADRPAVFFLLPIARDEGVKESARSLRHVCMPPHKFTEEPDGTLTIKGSILAYGWQGEPAVWHGYLTKGIWVEC